MDDSKTVIDQSFATTAFPTSKVVAALGLQAVVMAGLGFALWWWSGRAGEDFIDWTIRDGMLGPALGCGLIALAWIGFRTFPNIADKLVRMQAKSYGFLGGQLSWPVIVAVSIFAGVGEEALFRGGIQTFLGDHVGIPAAIALSSAAFVAIHLAKPVISALLFVIGAIFGIIYWQTESLVLVMIGHALYDIWALRYVLDAFARLGLTGQGQAAPLANPAGES